MRVKTDGCVILTGAPGSGLTLFGECLVLLGIGRICAGKTFAEQAAQINNKLLNALENLHPAASGFTDEWLNETAAEKARSEITSLLKAEIGLSGTMLFSDPTGFRLLPVWLECLHYLDITPKIVHIIRHPWEVAQTLKRRFGLSIEEGFRLWLLSNHKIIEACRDAYFFKVTFEQLLENPVNTMRHAGKALHLHYNCDLAYMYPKALVSSVYPGRPYYNYADMSEEDIVCNCVFTRLYDEWTRKLNRKKIYSAGEVPPPTRTKGQPLIIRTVHHLSGTGGTLICKAIAAMPDVVLLSELHPHKAGNVKFNPIDPFQHFQAAYPKLKYQNNLELNKYFLERLHIVVARCCEKGKHLVIRDHSHSDFLLNDVSHRNYLLDAINRHYDVKPIVTIRNPIDSYLSLVYNREHSQWETGIISFDQYCCRMLEFMNRYAFADLFRYEDFVSDPDGLIRKICAILNISFNASYRQDMHNVVLTGDSGRGQKEEEILTLERREYPEELRREVENSAYFHIISQRTGYCL